MDEKDPPEEPSHPWADYRREFDWDEERRKQITDHLWKETDAEREERLRSIKP